MSLSTNSRRLYDGSHLYEIENVNREGGVLDLGRVGTERTYARTRRARAEVRGHGREVGGETLQEPKVQEIVGSTVLKPLFFVRFQRVLKVKIQRKVRVRDSKQV